MDRPAGRGGDNPSGVLIAVSDHAVERFRQRVASRRGELDARPEIAARVSAAFSAGRVSSKAPSVPGREPRPARGAVYVSDLRDRDLIFVCGHDRRRGELVVITVWEQGRLGAPRVARRYTDELRRRR